MAIKHYKTFKELFRGTQIFLILSYKWNKYFYNPVTVNKNAFSWCNQALEEQKQLGKN